MKIKQHVVLTGCVFGAGYDEVHEWLDSYAKKRRAYRHWVPLHNRGAIDKKYPDGDIRQTVAYLHVVCDWLYHFGLWNLPANEEEVEQLLCELNAW